MFCLPGNLSCPAAENVNETLLVFNFEQRNHARVVQKVDKACHRVNCLPLVNVIGFELTHTAVYIE